MFTLGEENGLDSGRFKRSKLYLISKSWGNHMSVSSLFNTVFLKRCGRTPSSIFSAKNLEKNMTAQKKAKTAPKNKMQKNAKRMQI